MPAYNNPYYGPTYMPASYQPPVIGQASFAPYTQQSFAPAQTPVQQPVCKVEWVDGEIEARGHQIPQGVSQLYMFDTNSQTIYLKSLNQMGIPNPMQIMHYTVEEAQTNLPAGQSGSTPDMSQYVTKQDFDALRQEIRNLQMSGQNNQSGQNQNGSENIRSKGGNR